MAPSHASASRKGGGEALTGGVQAWLLSSEITSSGLPTLWSEGEGHTIRRVIASGVSNPRSLRPSACTQTLYTETGRSQKRPSVIQQTVRSGKARGRPPDMHATGKSGGDVASMKRTNKGAQPDNSGQPPAEFVEKRSPAKGNPGNACMDGWCNGYPVQEYDTHTHINAFASDLRQEPSAVILHAGICAGGAG
jgi:hypothetical protein